MDSTVVGSFPLENTPGNFKQAFIDQVNAGISIPCYPQLVDMNHQVLLPLSHLIDGLELKDKEFHLSGNLDIPTTIVATEYGQQVLDLLKEDPKLRTGITGIKACLTGPFTLCSNIIIDDDVVSKKYRPLLFQECRAHLIPEIVDAMARYVAKVTRAYKEMGFTIISIDDPFLSQIVGRRKILFHERDFIIETINKAAFALDGESSLHVCGVLSPLLRDLLFETNIHYLDHEFKTAPTNFDLFDRKLLEDHGKMLAFGAIQTNPVPLKDGKVADYVETIDDIVIHLQKAKERFGEENLLIKPDCGFGGMKAFDRIEPGLGHAIVLKKLKVMIAAIEQVFH